MRTSAVVLLALLLAACGEPKETALFAWEPPAAGGTVYTSYEHRLEPTVGVRRGGEKLREFTMKGERRVVLREEILRTGASPRIRVTYDVSTQYVPRLERTLETPTHGRSYVVSSVDGRRRVDSAEGRGITPDEERQVTRSFAFLERPIGLAGLLDGREIAIGESIEVPEERIGALFGTGDSPFEAKSVTLTLRETRGEGGERIAVFGAVFRATGAPGGGLSVRAELEGTIEVAVKGARPLRLELTGTVHVTGRTTEDGGEVEYRGSGPMHVKMTSRYEAP